jgi:hypothetical protein
MPLKAVGPLSRLARLPVKIGSEWPRRMRSFLNGLTGNRQTGET